MTIKGTSVCRNFEISPWSISACPKSWGVYSPKDQETGWYANLCVASYFGEIEVLSVSGEGDTLRAAERDCEHKALAALRRSDPSMLSAEQLAIRAVALHLLAVRCEDVPE